jgi:hypothetical protein
MRRLFRFIARLARGSIQFIAALATPYLRMILNVLIVLDRLAQTITTPANRWTARFLAWLTRWPYYRGPLKYLYEFFVAIWICRVSLASVVIGFLILWYSPQARDLLLDVRSQTSAEFQLVLGSFGGGLDLGSISGELLHAAILGAAVLLFWALPVEVCARWSLGGRARPPQTELARLTGVRIWPPRIPGPIITRLVPVLLGTSCFMAMSLAIGKLRPGLFDSGVNASAGFAKRQLIFLGGAMAIYTFIYFLAISRSFVETTRLVRGRPADAPSGTAARAVFLLEEIFHRYAGLTALAGTIILIWFVFAPQLSNELSRALVLPLVLGAVIPLFSFIAWLSAVVRLPLLIVMVIFVIVLHACVFEGHDIRIASSNIQTDARAVNLAEAVTLWRTHNRCADNIANCPKPIIVAAAGGASRAAYMTASTIGLFLDLTCMDQRDEASPPGACATTPEFANRLFAISGVSGGALGAGLISALLREQQDRQAAEPAKLSPCRADRTSTLWFSKGKALGWRQCLQIMLAEDFLSPVVIGLAFRDQIPLVSLLARDRAALLEDSWDRAFSHYAAQAPPVGRMALSAPFERLAPTERSWRPLLVFNGTSVSTGRRILTSHLTPSYSLTPSSSGKCLFKDAYDFHGMISVWEQKRVNWTCGQPPPPTESVNQRTVSIATAITNSARFPIISPPGTVRGSDGRLYVDRVIDGGYFENYGVTTAYDIAEALWEFKLDPAVLVITNEPTDPDRVKELFAGATIVPPLPETTEALPLAWARAPIGGLLETRSSRGDLAMIRLSTWLAQQTANDNLERVAHVTVYPEFFDGDDSTAKPRFKDVSMSWWLSKPIQEYLDDQLFQNRFSKGQQQDMLRRVCTWLGHGKAEFDLRVRCGENLTAEFIARDSAYNLTKPMR